MEAEGFVLDDAAVETDPSLWLRMTGGQLQALAAARVAGIQDGHIVLLS